MYRKYKIPLFQFVMGGHILPNISPNKLKIDGPVIISYSVHLKNSKTVIDYSLRSILKFFAYFLQRYRSWENSPTTTTTTTAPDNKTLRICLTYGNSEITIRQTFKMCLTCGNSEITIRQTLRMCLTCGNSEITI